MKNIHSYPYMQQHTKKNHDKCHTRKKKKDWPKYNVTVLNILPKSDTTQTIFASWFYCYFVLTLICNFATKYTLFELVKWSKGNWPVYNRWLFVRHSAVAKIFGIYWMIYNFFLRLNLILLWMQIDEYLFS